MMEENQLQGFRPQKFRRQRNIFSERPFLFLFLFDATKCGEPEVNRNQFGSSDTEGQALEWPRGISDVMKKRRLQPPYPMIF